MLTTDGSGTLSFSSVSGTTINNNADNRVITGSGTANTLEGEANFIFDGKNVGINRTSITQHATDVNTLAIQSDKNGKAGAIQLFSANDTVSSVIHQDTAGLALITNSSTSGARNDIVFQTASSEKMKITEAGLVGIGTSSPSTTLHVTSPAGSNKSAIITRSSGAEAVNLSEMQDYNALQILNKASGSYLNFAGNASNTQIQAQSDGNTAEDIALNPYGGNVGIGTTSPLSKMTIAQTAGNTALTFQQTNNSTTNFLIGSQYNIGNGFEITPSTAVGGSTFSSPALVVNASGCVGIGSGADRSLGTNITTTVTSGSAGSGFWLSTGDSSATSSKIISSTDGSVGDLLINQGSGVNGGAIRFSVNDSEKMRINSSGNLLINQTSSALTYGKLQVSAGGETAGHGGIVAFFDTDGSVASSNLIQLLSFSGDTDATGGQFIRFRDSNSVMGSVSAASGTTVAYNTSSDRRMKENIVDAVSQLDVINNIQIREFDWKNNGHHEVGVIAQELNEVIPNVVQEGGEDVTEEPWGVDYGKLTPYLVKAIQEQQTQIDALQSEINLLKGE